MRPLVLTTFLKSVPVASFPLQPGTYSVGRSPGCDINIVHGSVSRRHATLSVEGNRITLTDLNSRNGTFVAGARVKQYTLPTGRSFAFGSVQCEIGDLPPNGADDDETASHCGGIKLAATIPATLTTAQRRVAELLIRGDAEKKIAVLLGISIHTVHTHVRAIYRDLGVHSRAELSAKLLDLHGDDAKEADVS